MPQPIYSWDDTWGIPATAPIPTTPNLTSYINNFKDRGLRTTRLDDDAYFESRPARKNATVFLTKKAIQELLGIALPSASPNTEIVGITLRFGWDTGSGSVVLLARSSDGNTLRPAGNTDINFRNPDIPVDDKEYDDVDFPGNFSDNFKTFGYDSLLAMNNGATLSMDFSNVILYQLIFPGSPIPATINGVTKMHIVLAPPDKNNLGSGPWLSIVVENNLGTLRRGTDPCPPKCY